MKLLLAAAFLAGVAAPALAAPETYAVEPNHTAARFEYSHFGYTNQLHRFDKTSGKIVMDRAARTASVDVEIDAKTINTGLPVFAGLLQGEDYFDVAKYPVIAFKSRSVKFDGDKPVAVEGDLTIKGITKPVTLALTSFQAKQNPVSKRDALGAEAVAQVKRSEFGMGKFAPAVSDDVTLRISVEAFKD